MTDVENYKKLLFIMNPKAGLMQTGKYLTDIIELFSCNNYLTSVVMTEKASDGKNFVQKYGSGMDLIVCAGGDGTFNEIVDGIISSEFNIPIGYIPSGSTNDFGSSVGLPKGIMDAANMIMDGKERKLDIGMFNYRYFCYVASFGAFTSTSYSVPQNLKNIMGHLAYILKGIGDIINIKPVHGKFIKDEGTPYERIFEDDYIFGAICNSKSLAGILKLDNLDIDMNDGMMELILIRSPKNIIELNNIVIALLNGSFDATNIELVSAQTVSVEIEKGTNWTIDGEYEKGAEKINIKTLRSAIRLITGEE